MVTFLQNLTTRKIIFIASFFIGLQVIVLWLLGQPAICTCGEIKLWEGVVLSAGNSQHLSDWYTFSHIIHGFIFYFLSWLLFPRLSLKQRFLLALGLEVGWEILENTPWVINQYREQALAQGYTGDSVINSLSDTLAMSLGFWLAKRWPVGVTFAVAIGLEIFTGYFIRDGLALNIIGFLHQFDFITNWQNGS